ncbi:hypothetical protein DV736_g3650, partial [Chaetothyriales sp. CBS 134916]
MSSTQQHQQPPLSDLPTNTTTTTTHVQRLHPDIDEKKERTAATAPATAKYISPSDAMMSPTSKKLSEIKGRRFGASSSSSASVRARTMFARMREGRENENAPKEKNGEGKY